MPKIGILAGTFDPVHAGHLGFAKKIMGTHLVDAVVFMPEQQPRAKTDVTDFKYRLAMLKKATAGDKQLMVFDAEEKFFTFARTMPKLEKKYPDTAFVILVGSDVARRLADWQGIDKLKPSVAFLVALRSGDSEMSVRDKLSQPAIKPRISYVNSPEPQVAASLIRAGQAKTGIKEVDRYIAQHHLYD